MKPSEDYNIDQLLKEFKKRLRALIGIGSGEKKLAPFAFKVGLDAAQLSRWASDEHKDLPSLTNFIRICLGSGINPTWLLTGKGFRLLNLATTEDWQDARDFLSGLYEQIPDEYKKELLRKELAPDLRNLLDTYERTMLQERRALVREGHHPVGEGPREGGEAHHSIKKGGQAKKGKK